MTKRLFKRSPEIMRFSDFIDPLPRELTLRPCICKVNGKTCLFHHWIDEDKAMLKINCFVSEHEREQLLHRFRETSVIPMGTSVEIVRHTYALVEFPDGSVGKVEPESVCFMDKEGLDHE